VNQRPALTARHFVLAAGVETPDQVAAAEVLEVVREGTERTENGIEIPAGLEFDPLDFHDASMEQCVDVDWQATRKNAGALSPLFAEDFGESSRFFLIGAGYPLADGAESRRILREPAGQSFRPELVQVLR
jgi:hypothetical protein